ncbi:MAG: hypothetical protein GY790_00560, partial [Bacteroidetes bacterium]|nr:hypothetical protein [Bacteroidota bacterium]
NLLIEPRTGDLIDWAHKLSDEIYKLKRDTGTRKVDIVAYSAGGLTARWYIEKGYRNDVRKFISMASPHHGLDIGYWTWLLEWAKPEKGGGRQITPHSHFLNELNGHDGCATTRGRGTDQIKHDIPYYVITGNCLFTCPHVHEEIMGIDFRNGNVCGMSGDGLVPAESARLDGAEYTDEFCGKHSAYHARSDVRGKITEILHDDSLAHQNIVQASSVRTLTPLLQEEGNSMDLAENVLTAFHWSEPISDTISAGGIKSHPTHIEPDITKVIFELQGDCELDL